MYAEMVLASQSLPYSFYENDDWQGVDEFTDGLRQISGRR